MKGLFTKDLIILKSQLKTLLMIIACGIVMSFAFEKTIVIAYLGIIGTMVAIGTIGYDEFDNGFSYLFTLPVSRRSYVREKYHLSAGAAIVMILIGSVASFVMMVSSKTPNIMDEILPSAASMLMVAMLFISLLIPIRIKYNSEKSRTITYIIYAAILVTVFAGGKLLQLLGADIPGWIAKLDQMNPYVILGGLALVILAVVFLSEQYTERVIVKKEY